MNTLEGIPDDENQYLGEEKFLDVFGDSLELAIDPTDPDEYLIMQAVEDEACETVNLTFSYGQALALKDWFNKNVI